MKRPTTRPGAGGRALLLVPLVLSGCPAQEEESPLPDTPPREDTLPLPRPEEADPPGPDPTDADTGTAARPTEPPPRDTAGPPATEGGEPDTLPLEAPRREEGILGVTGTGTAPIAILRLDTGGSLGLTGAPARELRRLSGARVRIEGRDAATPIGAGIDVASYEVLEIEGEEPRVGILRSAGEAEWRLHPPETEPAGDPADVLVLEGLPREGLADGMKIWVVGEEAREGSFRVTAHGVIAPLP